MSAKTHSRNGPQLSRAPVVAPRSSLIVAGRTDVVERGGRGEGRGWLMRKRASYCSCQEEKVQNLR